MIYYDPLASHQWDDAEVARRWTLAFPPRTSKAHPQDMAALQELMREEMMNDPARLEQARLTLGSLSAFMKHLKQPIAWRANREDNCRAHFFESRFYSGALLSNNAVLACMAYVDLNPVRVKICDAIEGYRHTSIYKRLQHLEDSPERLQELLVPLVSGLGSKSLPQPMSLQDYIGHLRMLSSSPKSNMTDEQAAWFVRIASIKKRQLAYGLMDELKNWVARHGWRRMGAALC